MTTLLIVVNVLKGCAAIITLGLGTKRIYLIVKRHKRQNRKKPTAN